MRKGLVYVLLIALLAACLAGCGKDSDANYTIYYLNIDKTALVPKEVEIRSTKLDDILEELLDYMSVDTESVEYIRPIPSDVTIRECSVSEGNLIIDFSPQYSNLVGEKEVLTRSAIAKTMLQVEGVNSVSFYVANKPFTDDDGTTVASLTEDSFIDNYTDASGFIVKKEVSLYYANKDGEDLILEKKTIDVDERVPMAEVVLENIRKKPYTDGAQVAIPDDTRILNVAVYDGVCYVTLDSTLLTEKSDISNKAIIYSIVNSLCDSCDVKSVVIKTSDANDASQQNFLDISGTYVSDKSMVVQDVTVN